MPNVALLPLYRTDIPALAGVVSGYPQGEHTLSQSIGSYPLERGARVIDHAAPLPAVLDLTGIVSNLTAAGRGAGRAAWAELRRVMDESVVVRVVTPFGDYPEMLIQRLQARQVGAGGMSFTMRLVEVLRANVLATAPLSTQGIVADRGPVVDRGVGQLGTLTPAERVTLREARAAGFYREPLEGRVGSALVASELAKVGLLSPHQQFVYDGPQSQLLAAVDKSRAGEELSAQERALIRGKLEVQGV